MGIGAPAIKYLLTEHRRRPFAGRVLTLGRQGVWVDRETLEGLFAAAGVDVAPVPEAVWSAPSAAAGLPAGMVSDRALFAAFGFESTRAMDVSGYEGADVVHDLNEPVPESLRGAFDLIVDAGTLEHVFDQRTALANVVDMLSVGGRVFHLSPTSNYVDHGFYSLNPTLFLDFYGANGLEIERINLFRHTRQHDVEPWTLYAYPFEPDLYSFGGLGTDGLWGTFTVATRRADSTSDRIPLQGEHARRGAAPDDEAWTGSGWRGATGEALREHFAARDRAAFPPAAEGHGFADWRRRRARRSARRRDALPLEEIARL